MPTTPTHVHRRPMPSTAAEAEAFRQKILAERDAARQRREAMEEELRKMFPSFYPPGREPLWVQPGWKNLLVDLAERCLELEPDASLRYAKEKFGVLRVSVDGTYSLLSPVIDEIEGKSGRICEVCGEPGQTDRYAGLVATRCGEHGLALAIDRGADDIKAVWESRLLSAAHIDQEAVDDEDGGLHL